MTYTYKPENVCSRQFDFEIEDGVIKSLPMDAMETFKESVPY